VLRHEQNRGVARGRATRASTRARHEWVAFLDDDDLWAPHKLREQLGRRAGRTTRCSAYSAALVVNDRLEVIAVREAPPAEEAGGRA